MVTNVTNYYDLMSFGLGELSFQQFIDGFNEKYNTLNVDGYQWDNEIQWDYTYEQLIAASNIATLPIYVDESSEALDKAFGKFEIGSNKIPTQKHRYPVDAKMLRSKFLLAQKFGASTLTTETQNSLLDLLYTSGDNLIKGNRNAWTHQRMRINSTGQFVIDINNNPRGIKGLTFDFGIPQANKDTLLTTARWWTNSTHITANEGSSSDPLLYMKTLVKAKKKLGFPQGHIEMSIDLFDDLLIHSKVLQRIGYTLYPQATADGAIVYATNLTDDAKKAAMERFINCPIQTYDSIANVDSFDVTTKQLKQTTIENFVPTNIAFIPNGQLGTIKAVKPIVFTDDPTQRTAWFDGGRTLITNKFENKTKTMYVESEMATLCVPNMPQYMCISVVTV
jgi:hypothetical protein